MATITNFTPDSYGYAGSDGKGTAAPNDVAGVFWSLAAGSRYFVYNQAALQPSIRTDGKVGLSFAPGIAGAWGVWDYINRGAEGSSDPFTVEFDTVTSDTWMLTCLHRKWGAYSVEGNQATSVQVINAGSSGALPAVGSGTPARTAVDFFNVVNWDDDDQPLAMAKVSVDGQGNNTVTALRDLRVVGCGGGVQLIYDRLALQYLGYQGTHLLLWESGRWSQLYPVADSSGTFSWVEDKGPFARKDLSSLVVTGGFGGSASGWSTTGATSGQQVGLCRVFPHDNTIELDLRMRRSGGTLTTSSTGNFTGGDTLMFTLNSKYWPDAGAQISCPIDYIDSGGATHGGSAYINDKGEVWLNDGQANTDLGRQTGNQWSVALHASWTKAK